MIRAVDIMAARKRLNVPESELPASVQLGELLIEMAVRLERLEAIEKVEPTGQVWWGVVDKAGGTRCFYSDRSKAERSVVSGTRLVKLQEVAQ